jgi:hypothetical protein
MQRNVKFCRRIKIQAFQSWFYDKTRLELREVEIIIELTDGSRASVDRANGR